MIHIAAVVLAVNLIVPLTGHRARPIEPHTLFHTLFSDFFDRPDGTTYVQTGDIPAMWLRDSSEQSIPYVRYAKTYPVLAARFAGAIERNARNILVDPYANAFEPDYSVWERKWEPDGPAWPVVLTWIYWRQTGMRSIFTPALHKALRKVVDTWRCEQLHAQCSTYRFPQAGSQNAPFNPGTGMVWGAFRPSDDAAQYPFNIPQQALVAVALQELARLAIEGYGDTDLANEASSMSAQIQTGIETYGRVWRSGYGGWVYVFETDGLGHDVFADDANIPNLTALPYIGYCSAYDPVYLNTRAYVLSKQNPWYFSGTYAQGLGSPHTPAGFIWPLGIIGRALTATSAAETIEAVTMLAETDKRDGLIHESFYDDGYWLFTRAEFGWGNALYAELIFRSVAGFDTIPFPADGRALKPFQRYSQTPRLVSALDQITNTGMLYRALGDLLEEAAMRRIDARALQNRRRPGRNGGP